MTKAAIWNQLKTEYEYSSSFLNKLYGVTYQQASKELLESILEQLQKEVGQGVNEDLGSQCGGGTVVPVKENGVKENGVNYIVTLTDYPQVVIKDDYNPKELTEVTEQQLVSSIYTDKTTAEMMFPGSYYQVLEVNPNNIKQQLMNHYNLEETSTVATVTSDNTYYALVHSQADEVYIVTPYCLNPKRLVDCKAKELKESLYHCKEAAADEANEWLGDNYQVVEVDYNNICCDIKAYFRNRVLVNQLNCYLPKDEASTKGYYYKGVSVEHFSNYTEMYNNVLNPVDSGNPTVTLLGSFQHTKWVYCSEIKVSSSIEAVKVAKNYLSTEVKQQQVPSIETGNYHYSQMQLTPKLELFSLMTEFVFLMECYLELTTYFFNLSSSLYDANHQLYLTWNIICSICFKRYVCMPSKGDSTYGILLRIHNQAMKQSSLERKSIYA